MTKYSYQAVTFGEPRRVAVFNERGHCIGWLDQDTGEVIPRQMPSDPAAFHCGEMKPESDGLRPFKPSARLGREDLERLGDWLEKNADMAAKIAAGYSVADLIDDLGAIEAGIHNERVDLGLVEGGD